ncbi:peroxiredoxin Q [Collybia nuda]|uniref:thioredoxin-dependent peroxiredoxin n=1 Tax=Collybia nuda TaxID=64659 RepID=A0A9P6CQF6_9AGAR|nr:peroxiredoxin Q [Collybia nuda]
MSYDALFGKTAPALTLPNYTGESYTMTPGEDGLPIVLFFYPKAGSSGCTKEVCQFRDAIAEKAVWKTDKVRVIGLSKDSVEKQKAFVQKEKLTYPVLSDVHGEALKAYGVGRALLGLLPSARVTFIIDKKGIVRDALEATLDPAAHTKFVTGWLEKLEAEN